MESTELRRSTLERKDRDELVTIATALGAKPPSKARKAEIVDLIITTATTDEAGGESSSDAPEDDKKPKAKKKSSKKAHHSKNYSRWLMPAPVKVNSAHALLATRWTEPTALVRD